VNRTALQSQNLTHWSFCRAGESPLPKQRTKSLDESKTGPTSDSGVAGISLAGKTAPDARGGVMPKLTIGFIGLGDMGEPMAAKLLEGGLPS